MDSCLEGGVPVVELVEDARVFLGDLFLAGAFEGVGERGEGEGTLGVAGDRDGCTVELAYQSLVLLGDAGGLPG